MVRVVRRSNPYRRYYPGASHGRRPHYVAAWQAANTARGRMTGNRQGLPWYRKPSYRKISSRSFTGKRLYNKYRR